MRGGPKQIASLTQNLTRTILARPGSRLTKLKLAWFDIVGSEFASRTMPLKLAQSTLHHRDMTRPTVAPKSCLWLEVESADALMLHYAAPDIISRINRYFGEVVVTDVRFHHTYNPGFLGEHEKKEDVTLALTLAEEEQLRNETGKIVDSGMRETLLNFGRALRLMKKRSK